MSGLACDVGGEQHKFVVHKGSKPLHLAVRRLLKVHPPISTQAVAINGMGVEARRVDLVNMCGGRGERWGTDDDDDDNDDDDDGGGGWRSSSPPFTPPRHHQYTQPAFV